MKIVLNRVIFYDIPRILKSKKIEILFTHATTTTTTTHQTPPAE
jgi:hypothetical protein